MLLTERTRNWLEMSSKIRWAISTFQSLKSAGTVGIVTALLQQGVHLLKTHLCHTFRTSLARQYIPKAWKQVNMTFIPNPRNTNYTKAEAYCPISVLSFIMIMMELVTRKIRDKILGL